MKLYQYLQQTKPGTGCTECRFRKHCGHADAGYTMMDEYGVCPVEATEELTQPSAD